MAEATEPPSVSVIMPSANARATITEAIQSVQAQSYDDWELLISFNGCTDGADAIADGFSRADSRVRPFVASASRIGPGPARNAALERAQGRYIAFLDSDDFWLPDKLEMQLRDMALTGAALSFTAYREVPRDYVGGHRGDFASHGRVWRVPTALTQRQLARYCVIGCLTAVYDTAIVGKQAMRDIPAAEDYDLWLRILEGNALGRGLSTPLAVYRSASRNHSASGRKRHVSRQVMRVYRDTLHKSGASLYASWVRYGAIGVWRRALRWWSFNLAAARRARCRR